MPPSARMRSCTTGLVEMKFDGAKMSSHWRAAKPPSARDGASRRERPSSHAATTAGRARSSAPRVDTADAARAARRSACPAAGARCAVRGGVAQAAATARPRHGRARAAWPETRQVDAPVHVGAERGRRRDGGAGGQRPGLEMPLGALVRAKDTRSAAPTGPSQGLASRSRAPAIWAPALAWRTSGSDDQRSVVMMPTRQSGLVRQPVPERDDARRPPATHDRPCNDDAPP